MMSSNGRFATRQLAILLIMAIPACMRDLPTVPASPLFISGLMSPLRQGIQVAWNGVPVTDAEVTVNNIRMPHCCGDLYVGNLPEEIAPGGTLRVKVVAEGRTFEAAGKVIGTPAITAPAAGSTFAATDSIPLKWSMSEDPDRFEVCANCIDNSNESERYPAPGSARALTIRPDALVDYYGEGTVVAVYARKNNFLKSAGSTEGTSNVLFVARSRNLLLFVKH